MHALTALCLLPFLGALATAAAASPPTEREARALLAPARDSTSLGRTSDGALLNAVALPKRGQGYALLSMVPTRRTGYGTRELITAIERAAARVEAEFPGSVLAVGNLGFESGTKIPWSVSHQAGRDGDLGMYALLADGKRWEDAARGPMPFAAFDAALGATMSGRAVRFDLARNLALVRALVEDAEARVQYIFVAAWLKQAMLEEGRRRRLPAQTLARLGEVLHQPTDSNPHADHFHVRLFCSVEDRLQGCLDRAPARAWIDPGDRELAEFAAKVGQVLGLTERRHEKLVIAAIERLEAIRAAGQVTALTGALADARPKVRARALQALEVIGDPGAAEGILAILPRVEDAGWAARLFAAIPRLQAGSLVPLAQRVLADPGALLHPKAKRAEVALMKAALEVLRDHGASDDGASVALALGALGHRDAGVKKASQEALRYILCQPIASRAEAARYWADRARNRAEDHAAAGLRARRLLTREPKSRAGVEQLIGLLDRREGEVRVCAQRLLTAVTGHDSDAALRGPQRNKRHWVSWWKDNRETLGLP